MKCLCRGWFIKVGLIILKGGICKCSAMLCCCYTNSPLVDPSFFFLPLLIRQTWRNGSEPESFPLLIDPSKKCQFHFPGAWSRRLCVRPAARIRRLLIYIYIRWSRAAKVCIWEADSTLYENISGNSRGSSRRAFPYRKVIKVIYPVSWCRLSRDLKCPIFPLTLTFLFFSALDDWSSKKSSRTAKYLALHEQLPTKLLAFNFLLRLCCSINDPQAHSEVTHSLRVYPKYRKTAIKSKQANVLNQTRDLQQVNRQWANCGSQRQSRKKKAF